MQLLLQIQTQELPMFLLAIVLVAWTAFLLGDLRAKTKCLRKYHLHQELQVLTEQHYLHRQRVAILFLASSAVSILARLIFG